MLASHAGSESFGWTAWLQPGPARKRFENNAGTYLQHIAGQAPHTPPPGVSAMGTRAWHGAALALGVACAAACAAVASAGVRWGAVCIALRVCAGGLSHRAFAPPSPPPRADSARRAAHAPQFRAACGVAACEGASARPKNAGLFAPNPLGCARSPCQTDSLTHSVP